MGVGLFLNFLSFFWWVWLDFDHYDLHRIVFLKWGRFISTLKLKLKLKEDKDGLV